MAAGVTVAAVRSRPRQAVLVAALAAVVTTAAALGPLYSRAVEQSVLRHVIAAADVTDASVVVTDSSAPVTAPDDLAEALRPSFPRELGAPIGGADAPVRLADVEARLSARDQICEHITVPFGRCATAAGEVMLSRRTAVAMHIQVGARIPLTRDTFRTSVTVVGVYDGVDPTARYWAGRTTSTSDAAGHHVTDDLLTSWATLATSAWPDLRTHLDVPVRASRMDLRRTDALRSDLQDLDDHAQQLGAFSTSAVPALLTSAEHQRRQSGDVILLLTVQLAVLGLVVLAYVGAAVTEQRRPEIALARLRGLGDAGATGVLLREMALLLVAGGVGGTVLALLTSRVATALWLEPGVPLEVRRSLLVPVGAAFAAGLLAILAAATPTLRQPVVALLRRVPQRVSALRMGIVEGGLVAAAAAGVVTLVYGQHGTIALLGPGLLALAGGLLLSQLVVPVAGPLARRSLRRGNVASAMAAMQIARRPALRRLIAIVTVSCALLVFAVDAWAVAAHNRSVRADVDAGAAVVLTVDAASPEALRSAVLGVDPTGGFATPVVAAHSPTPAGPRALAVEPAAFARIARWGLPRNRPAPASLDALDPLKGKPIAPLPLPTGTTGLAVQAVYTSRDLPPPRSNQEPARPISLQVAVRRPTGGVDYLEMGRLLAGRQTYRTAVHCDGCQLSGFVVARLFGDAYPVEVSLRIEQVNAQVGTAAVPIALGPATPAAWQVLPSLNLPTTAQVHTGSTITIFDPSSFESAEVRRGDIPTTTPALVAGDVPAPFGAAAHNDRRLVVAPDLSGAEHLYAVTSRLPLVPREGTLTVLTDLRSITRAAGTAGANTSYQVWLAADDAGRERALRAKLAARGLQVIARDTAGAHERAFGREGPTLALRLALLAGLIALLLAAAVLVVGIATSGTGRARDLAGLRIVGVPTATLRRAAVLEHVVVAALGALAGSGLGLAAAQAALPDVPLFAESSALVPVQLHPAWTVLLATAGLCLVVLCAVSVVVGRALVAAASPEQLREGT